jgi:ribosomal protein S18 acetylase RimI-like enzyme
VRPRARIRPATDADLGEIYDIWYRDEIGEDPDPPPNTTSPDLFAHNVRTGDFHVAEGAEGRLLGFSGAIVRGDIRFLTDLFVRPEAQDQGLGQELLDRAMPADGRRHATLSSRDPRAQALYIRSGMRPRFPHFILEAEAERIRELETDGVEVGPADASDPALVAMDAEIGGRLRPEDHADWVGSTTAGVPLWLDRGGEHVGYAYVRLRSPAFLRHPDWATVAPAGACTDEGAAGVVLAAVGWAASRAPGVTLGVPGPHPALGRLLDAGFRITYVELFLSSSDEPFTDPGRYVPSGSGEF